MARGKTETDTASGASALINQLRACTTSAELWKLGQSDAFQAEVQTLSDDDLESVRNEFKNMDAALKGRVKAEEVQDIPLTITDWDFNTSPQFPDREFVVVKGTRDDNGSEFQLVSGAYKIKQFFTKLGVRTKANTPQHITIVQETSEAMHARNAKPGTGPMWLVKQASTTARKASKGSPF